MITRQTNETRLQYLARVAIKLCELHPETDLLFDGTTCDSSCLGTDLQDALDTEHERDNAKTKSELRISYARSDGSIDVSAVTYPTEEDAVKAFALWPTDGIIWAKLIRATTTLEVNELQELK